MKKIHKILIIIVLILTTTAIVLLVSLNNRNNVNTTQSENNVPISIPVSFVDLPVENDSYTNRKESNVIREELGYSYYMPLGYENWFEKNNPLPRSEAISAEYVDSQEKPQKGYQTKTIELSILTTSNKVILMDWIKSHSSSIRSTPPNWYISSGFEYIDDNKILYVNDENTIKINGASSPLLIIRIDDYSFLEVSQALSQGDNSLITEIISSLKIKGKYALTDSQLEIFKSLITKYEKE